MRSLYLLGAGALMGIGLAFYGLVSDETARRDALGDRVAAKINDSQISHDAYETHIGRLAADKRNELTDDDRAHVLERLIEEELLIQRGVEIGLVERERAVRAAIVQSMINAIIADTLTMDVPEGELADFYEDNGRYFVGAAQLHIRALLIRKGDDPQAAFARAEQAHARLRDGAPVSEVRAQFGDAQIVRAPDGLLPAAKLRDYVGPTVLAAALRLNTGDVSDIVETPTAYHIFRVINARRAAIPPLDQVREQVLSEYRKRAGDKALRDYLEWLKSRADLVRLVDFDG
ncbi:MAG: peptidylprolyl isomerase [Alphaproteobacteria bacterium]